jgi:hypothetical protein
MYFETITLSLINASNTNLRSWCISVRIESVTEWTTGIRSPAEAKDFSCSLCFQTNSEDHQVSYPTGTGGSFSEVKRGRGKTLTTHPIGIVSR